jgi:hypothetical protein
MLMPNHAALMTIRVSATHRGAAHYLRVGDLRRQSEGES